MKRLRRLRKCATAAMLGITTMGLALFSPACQSADKGAAQGEDASAGEEFNLSRIPIHERGGAQLWGDNCGRCHNVRDPTEFTDAGWDVVAHHMRVRANLTAYEHRVILEFLQSAN